MTKVILAVLITSFLLSITTPFAAAFPFTDLTPGNLPDVSSLWKRCLFSRFLCFGQSAEPEYRESPSVSYAPAESNNIVLQNNNEVTIAVPPAAPVYAAEQVETSTVAVFVTEIAPETFISSETEVQVLTETLPAETVVVTNFDTVTEEATAFVTQVDVATQTLPAETVTMNNYLTVNQQDTVSVTESVFATETLPAETVVVSNYLTVTESETASVTESVFATETLPAETIVSNSELTVTELATYSMTEIDTETQTLPAETVMVSNYYTVTEVETTSVIAFETPAPAPYSFLVAAQVPAVAPCEACEATPVCVEPMACA